MAGDQRREVFSFCFFASSPFENVPEPCKKPRNLVRRASDVKSNRSKLILDYDLTAHICTETSDIPLVYRPSWGFRQSLSFLEHMCGSQGRVPFREERSRKSKRCGEEISSARRKHSGKMSCIGVWPVTSADLYANKRRCTVFCQGASLKEQFLLWKSGPDHNGRLSV